MIRDSVLMFSVAAVGIACATALTHASQVRCRQGPALVAIEVSLKVGGASYVTKALGSCTHAPKASIYDVPAQLWSVQQASGERPVRLTLWKPSDGSSSMFSLSVNDPMRSISISTVRGGEVTGSGTVTLAAVAKGGTFTVDARAKTGESIAGTITCAAFTPHAADGGN
jgi:hypothetical protein